MDSKLPPKLQSARQRSMTPFSKTRSPSPSGPERQVRSRTNTAPTKINLRKRSPSPVVTGKVNTFRNKFENQKQNGVSSSILNNTVPRTFRNKTPECQDIGKSRLPAHFIKVNQSPMVARKHQTGTSLYTSISPTGTKQVNSAQQEKPWSMQQINSDETSDIRTVDMNTCNKHAATFLRTTLPRQKKEPGNFCLENISVKKGPQHVKGPFGFSQV